MKFIQLFMVGVLFVFVATSCKKENVTPDATQPTTNTKNRISSNTSLDISSSLTADYTLSFTTTTSGLAGTYFRWNFGDGTTITTSSSSTTHKYACTSKTYNVTVQEIIYSIGTVVGSGSASVAATPVGGAYLMVLYYTPLGGNQVSLLARYGDGCAGNKYYHWTYGDGTTGMTTSSSSTHQYPSTGYYTASVTIKDGAGNFLSGPAVRSVYAN